MTEPNEIVIEVTVATAPQVVWQAMRDPALIRRWHGWNDPSLDEEVAMIYLDPDEEDPTARTFAVGSGDRFSVHDTSAGTVVRITRPAKGIKPEWDEFYDDITEGWIAFLEQLRFGVEQHALRERQTLMLQGSTETDPRESLGIDVTVAESERYQADSATGDQLSGTVRLRAKNLTVYTVDEWGPGLLIVGKQPINPQRPQGGWQVVLTTYGLSQPDHAELAQRWEAWWNTLVSPSATATAQSI
jgi:hypothetical protein